MKTLLEFLEEKRTKLNARLEKEQYTLMAEKSELVRSGTLQHINNMVGEKELILEIEKLIFSGEIGELK